jgi:hypothetical protein
MDSFVLHHPQTPAQSAPCGYGWVCAHCISGWYCIPGPTASRTFNPVPSAAALFASATLSVLARFLLPKLSIWDARVSFSQTVHAMYRGELANSFLHRSQEVQTAAASSSIPSTMASFTASPPSLPPSIATAPTSSVPTGSITCADGSLVIRTQDCLDGVLGATLSSLLAFRTTSVPAIAQVNAAAGNVADLGSNINSNIVADLTSVLNNVQGLTGGLLSTVVADVTSILEGANGAVDSITPTILADTNNAPRNVVGHIETAVGSVPTLLPIVPTVSNDIPIANMVVNSASADLPVVNNVGLTGGLGSVGLKARRRAAKRDIEVARVVDVRFCGQNPDHESCGW